MNCKHVQELLPLYVGHDLEEKRANLVTAHVQSCAPCASSADEYRKSRQLLQLFAPPLFSETVYAEIRQRVLRDIERESNTPTLAQLFASLFRPRIRWAVATALLLAVSVLAFYFIANRRPTLKDARQQVADTGRTLDRTTPDQQPNARSQDHEPAVSPSSSSKESDGPRWASTGASTGRHMGADATIAGIAGSVHATHQSPRRKSLRAAGDRAGSVAVNTADTRSIAGEASPEGNSLAEPDAVLAHDPATSEKTLRVEMQTKDRNIRIIWFSPQRSKQDSPGKSSQGIQEVRSYA